MSFYYQYWMLPKMQIVELKEKLHPPVWTFSFQQTIVCCLHANGTDYVLNNYVLDVMQWLFWSYNRVMCWEMFLVGSPHEYVQ